MKISIIRFNRILAVFILFFICSTTVTHAQIRMSEPIDFYNDVDDSPIDGFLLYALIGGAIVGTKKLLGKKEKD
tara:strand:- start:3991 stop:4212 length:222 start_codon:yes stop_codon:yes gene_type:complete